MEEQVKRPVGRPPEGNSNDIWNAEVLQLVKLSREFRKFAGEQLEKLQKDAEGITNAKQRLEVLRTVSTILSDLTKTTKTVIEQTKKGDEEDSGGFNFADFVEEAKK